jgi:hypothetical protein
MPAEGWAQQLDAQRIAAEIAAIKDSRQPWTTVPWVASLLEARQLSEREQVPVFLFSYEGDLAAGNC